MRSKMRRRSRELVVCSVEHGVGKRDSESSSVGAYSSASSARDTPRSDALVSPVLPPLPLPPPPPPPPMLTLLQAHALAVLFGASYVLSVYALPRARLGPAGQGRDNPAVIRARLLAVCASTVLSCGVVGWVVWTERKLDGIGGGASVSASRVFRVRAGC
jgi:hypothetical protein